MKLKVMCVNVVYDNFQTVVVINFIIHNTLYRNHSSVELAFRILAYINVNTSMLCHHFLILVTCQESRSEYSSL